MKVAVEKQDKNVAQINLEIASEQALQEYSKACKRISQRLNIPGFRRGKAPRAVIEKTVGIERIKQEAMDRLLPHLFADAISEHQLDIVAPPQIENYKFDLTEGIQVKAQVELRPEVKLPEGTDLKVDVPRSEIPADSEEKELQALVERMTTLEPVIDRPTVATDIVHIDFTGSINGELIRGGSAKNYRLDLANNNFIEGFAEQLVGHKIGEEFTINVTFPKDYHDNTLAGKPADFQVKVNEIKKKVVPELTDELARKVGNYENLDQLKAEIRRFLEENQEQENTARKQKAVIEAYVEKAEVEIPDSMINREAKYLLEEVQQRFKGQGLSWEQFLDSQGHETIWENLRVEGKKRIKTSLVFGALAKQENITVKEDEFMGEVRELAQTLNKDEKLIMRELANRAEATQALNDQILSYKIVDFLLERATINFVEETASPAEEAKKVAPGAVAEVSPVAAAIEGEEFEVLADE